MLTLVAWSLIAGDEAHPTRPIDGLVCVVALSFATGCAVIAAGRAHGRRRYGWLAMTAALVSWVIGEFLAFLTELTGVDQPGWQPTPAQAVLVVFPIAALASLLLLSEGRGVRWRLVLDGTVVATSLFVVSWVFVLDGVAHGTGGDGGARLATVGQVVADLVLLTAAILVWSRSPSSGAPFLALLVTGMMAICAADITTVYIIGVGGYHSGSLLDLVRVAGIGLVAAAALSSIDEKTTGTAEFDIRPRDRVWLPYLPLVLAGVVGMGYAFRNMHNVTLLAAEGALVAAVLARQAVVLVQNQRLLTEVAREALRDSLTGLANRAHFLASLERALERGRREDRSVGVLCVDLDDFKEVNDALGHPAGDELLVRVAGRLTECVDDSSTLARLGGDEFAVLVEGSAEDLQVTAQRILDRFEDPIVVDGVPLTVRPSLGLTVGPPGSPATVDELIRHADLAMYAAKHDGGGCARSFVPYRPFPYELPQPAEKPNGAVPAAATVARAAARPSTWSSAQHRRMADIPGVGWPPPVVAFAIALLTIAVIIFASSTLLRDLPGRHLLFDVILYPAVTLAAAGLVIVRAFRVAAERRAWLFIAAAMASSALGDIVYEGWVSDGRVPSPADPLYLAFYPLMYMGLVMLIRTRLSHVPSAIRLDALVCVLTVTAVAAALATGPLEEAMSESAWTVVVGLAYPAGDLLLLTLAVGVFPSLGWRNEARWRLLVAAFAVFAAADVIYVVETLTGSYQEGAFLDAGWLLAALFIAIASWQPTSRVTPRLNTGLGLYLPPVMFTAVALGVCVFANGSRIAVALAAMGLTAVAARFALTFRDRSAAAERHRLAMTDELTGLPNRRSLATTLAAMAIDEQPTAFWRRSRVGLLWLDIEELQEINTLVGSGVRDELLCRIAGRLSKCLRPQDQLVRAGGDTFAVLLTEDADITTARAQAGALLEALGPPFALDQITVKIDASIAIAMCPDHCDQTQGLVDCAEITIPFAKTATTKIAVYDSAHLDQFDESVVEELQSALSNDELTCYYQPKITARDRQIHSVEALLRWNHPTLGLLLPESFLQAAERAGLMRQVANWVVDSALGQIRSWRDEGINLTVAVNLSSSNLLDLDLVDTIEQTLHTHRLPAEALIVEITESTLTTDSVRSRNTVAALRELGVRISLDDYGTGWSSLARLQDLSVDELKLDKVFVTRLSQDPRSIAIVRSTVALAKSLGADLVAEGVEDHLTLGALERYGCNITQGFVHTPPLPADQLGDWMAEYTPAPVGIVHEGVVIE
jgi:diguanylate cyclase (GGDEF)-like protein